MFNVVEGETVVRRKLSHFKKLTLGEGGGRRSTVEDKVPSESVVEEILREGLAEGC